jgi:hypothetical protein
VEDIAFAVGGLAVIGLRENVFFWKRYFWCEEEPKQSRAEKIEAAVA